MIILRCPYCRELKSEDELSYGGEAWVSRPLEPHRADDEQWTDYLHMRSNPKGLVFEQWCCSSGCGQWFKVERDTATHAVLRIVRFDAEPRAA